MLMANLGIASYANFVHSVIHFTFSSEEESEIEM